MRFYFASKLGNLTKVKPLTTISKNPCLIYNLNLTDYYTGKKIEKNEKFSKFHPYLYQGIITKDCIGEDKKGGLLFSNKKEISIKRVYGIEYNKLIRHKCNTSNDMTNFN